MPGLLIDYENIVHPNLKLLLSKLKPPPKTRGKIGLILILAGDELNTLKRIKKGSKRVDYINSKEFVNNIEKHYYSSYDGDKKICEIGIISKKYLPIVVNIIIRDLPSDTTIWAGVLDPDNDRIQGDYIKAGFNSPYICKKSPLGNKFSDYGVAYYKANIFSKDIDTETEKYETEYVISQYKSKDCMLLARLKPSSIKYLKSLTEPVSTMNKNGELTQKEFAGALKVGKISKIKGKLVFNIFLDRSSIKTGMEENVDAVWSRYNFHTHPKQAYIRHKVKNGWPSAQDYLGYSKFEDDTIFHVVVTLEGLYVISYNKNGVKVSEKFITDNYDIDHTENIEITEYVDRVNKIKYKDKPVFSVHYLTWKNPSVIFPVFYTKTGLNCLATQSGFGKYNKYYK